MVYKIKPNTIYNVCRWKFPGEWVTKIANSWRVSGDIRNNFNSLLRIIDLNTNLAKYASPGHVNDMDILQVGRGMTYEEDKAHFSMWCMLNSPLLAGNDLRSMSDETLSILTNKEVIALNQDELVYQARLIKNQNGLQVWAKPLHNFKSGEIAVALLNRTKEKQKIVLDLKEAGIGSQKGYQIRDLWKKTDLPESSKSTIDFMVELHGIVVLKIRGNFKANNFFSSESK